MTGPEEAEISRAIISARAEPDGATAPRDAGSVVQAEKNEITSGMKDTDLYY